MTTTVFRFPKTTEEVRHAHPCLIAHLRSTTPDEAIEKLAKAGVLALYGPEPSSIVLVGFTAITRQLLLDFKRHGGPCHPETRYLLGKLRKLAS